MRNRARKCSAVVQHEWHPLATEAVWSEISRHLTVAQWARVAGTCRVSWRLQLHPQVDITLDLPLAGYLFVLKRCKTASVLSVTLDGKQRAISDEAFRSALWWKFRNVKQLRFIDGKGYFRAFDFYKACPDLQVASLASAMTSIDREDTWPLMRHLDVETDMRLFLERQDLQASSQLETLRLCQWRNYRIIAPINDLPLELASLNSLGSLHIEDWAPKSISVTAGCGVYAVWRQAEYSKDQEWLLSPCWSDPSTNLVSLQWHVERLSLTEPDIIHAIKTIVERHAALELLRVTAPRLGSEGFPLTLPTLNYKRRAAPLKLEIHTSNGCWLHLFNTWPFSKSLILETRGPLHIGLPATLESLEWYALDGHLASNVEEGPLSLQWQLVKALSPAENMDDLELQAANDMNMEVDAANDMNMEVHAAPAPQHGIYILRCLKRFVGQCYGVGPPNQ